ncbi:MAG: SPOR domain-containing protein [Clostridiales bacterium]|nr:SPOR domain-containing protein [Clostridiales bacterium]
MKRYRLKRSESLKPLLAMLLIIIFCAVILGYFGTRYIVYPVFIHNNTKNVDIKNNGTGTVTQQSNIQSTQTQVQDSKQNSETKLKDFYVYHIQLGNFSSEENANALVNELKGNGIYAYILNDNGYKVVTTPAADYDKAAVIKEKLLTYAVDAFVLKRIVYVENTSVQTSIQNIINYLYEAHTESAKINDAWMLKLKDLFQEGSGDMQLAAETIQTFQKIYDEVNNIKSYQNIGSYDLEKIIITNIENII